VSGQSGVGRGSVTTASGGRNLEQEIEARDANLRAANAACQNEFASARFISSGNVRQSTHWIQLLSVLN
jgi:hypothetical protein